MSAVHPTALAGLSLLVLEDDPDTAELFSRSLSKLGAEVRSATSADVALAILDEWRADAVLCDLHMPGTDGYGFLERVRARAELGDLPVIAISASHPSIERDHALEAGFAAHLVKPTPIADIIATVHSVLGR